MRTPRPACRARDARHPRPPIPRCLPANCQDERQVGPNLVVAANQQTVEVADTDAGNIETHLPLAGRSGIFDLVDLDGGGIAEFMNLDGAHRNLG